MRYYKIIDSGYIAAIGTGCGGTEITKTEFDQLRDLLSNCPVTAGYSYRLTESLSWESFLTPSNEDEEITPIEALDITVGGGSEISFTRSEAHSLRDTIEQAVESLDNSTALNAITLFPVWFEGTEYSAGQRVRCESALYLCLSDHIAVDPPSDAPLLWEQILVPEHLDSDNN